MASASSVPKRLGGATTLRITPLLPENSVTKACLPGASPTARVTSAL